MTDKSGRLLFKIGGIALIVLGLVHSLSLFGKPVPANDTERQLFNLMDDYHFVVMGAVRSMSMLLRGFSISFMFAALGIGAIDWSLCRERSPLLKRVALVNVIWLFAMIAISLRYFFAAPTSFLTLAFLIFIAAWLKLPSSEGAN